jgi:hypothetical protein
MAYDEKYRRQAIAHKESGHTFKELEAAKERWRGKRN